MCHRFQGLNGQIAEFQLKPDWTLPLQEEPEDWDINPATEDMPLEQVLADAAVVRQEHLEGMCEHVNHMFDTPMPDFCGPCLQDATDTTQQLSVPLCACMQSQSSDQMLETCFSTNETDTASWPACDITDTPINLGCH